MNWNNFKLREVEYFCVINSRIDFDCLPFSTQLEHIVAIFHHYQTVKFQIQDIREFYEMINISSPRTGCTVRPTAKKIENQLLKMKNIRAIDDEIFEILSADTTIYIGEIEYGYHKGDMEK